MKLIITRPQHDVTTSYLFDWAKEIIQLAQNKGLELIDLCKNKANRRELTSRIKKLNPKLLFFNGHGSDDNIAGHNNEILIKAEDNHQLLKGKITYALACNSGKKLGKVATSNNEATYIGYADEFIFMADNKHINKALKDPLAKPFMESSNQIMVALLKGHSAKEASERSKKLFAQSSRKLMSSSADPNELQAAQFLWWNMQNQVCLGDAEAKLIC